MPADRPPDRACASDRAVALAAAEDRLDALRALRATYAAAETAYQACEDEHSAAELEVQAADTQLDELALERATHSGRGSVLYAVLYTMAGFFFVAGDVIMSREVVASALKLRGAVEPWIFALGLAMLAFVIKPAYDRLVEEPYWQGRRWPFAGTILATATAALATLWVLGAFRATAFIANSRIQRLSAELAEASDPAALASIQNEIGHIQAELMSSPLGYWAFVLSGVLFALAGAICLGIGFQHARDAYHVRWPLHRRVQRLRTQRAAAQALLETLHDERAKRKTELARLRQRLDDGPSLRALSARCDALRAKAFPATAGLPPTLAPPRGDGAPSQGAEP